MFVLKERHIIDLFKGITILVLLLLIYFFDQADNPTLWLYAALHGSYGILWCLKSQIFPDKNWEKPVTFFRFILLVSGLISYWSAPLTIAFYGTTHHPVYHFFCLVLFIFGLFFHFTSDMHKYISLKLAPSQLITQGIWSTSRNPNYFGEFLIYLSFALLANHWLPFLFFSLIILLEWVPNMIRKERSLSRYAEFAEYRRSSGVFFPIGLFKQNFLSLHPLEKRKKNTVSGRQMRKKEKK
jgi:protein-S-isoprenylcysteine O-methyltransferase Ste14